MPKSKRNRIVNLTQVSKKTREQKDKLFANIRETVPEYQHCFVFAVDNMRNNYLKQVRHELTDCRFVAFPYLSPQIPNALRPSRIAETFPRTIGTSRLTPDNQTLLRQDKTHG